MSVKPLRGSAARRLSIFLTLFAATATGAMAQLVISSNPQYFNYNGTPIALVGISGEYLPHVTRPTKQNDYATWESYIPYINDITARGLNKIHIWADINHSIGFLDGLGAPYQYEQPFFWNGSRWRLDRFEPNFFTRLKAVIAYAETKGVIVEVTLFDVWQGDYTTSPWYPVGRNIWFDSGGVQHADAGFTQRGYMASFENGNVDVDQRNIDTRALQVKYVQRIVSELNQYRNFYWEIANEPDFNTVSGPINITAMVNWHNFMAQTIVAAEAPLPNKHKIGVNFITQAAVTQVRNGLLNPAIEIVSGHYVDISVKNGTPARWGAITMNRTYNSTATPINKVFGFNETTISPAPSNRLSSRAEAWEFMMSEGGLYDNLGYQWNTPVETKPCTDPTIAAASTALLRCDLGRLTGFLAPLNLANMSRQIGQKPSWITNGLVNYGAFDPIAGTNTFWGAMQWAGQQYAFYYHHSTISAAAGAKKYDPVVGNYSPAGLPRSFTFSLGGAAGFFKLEWFYYAPGSPKIQSTLVESIFWNGTPIVKNAPNYNYDLGIRITRCPGAGAC